MFLAMRLCQSSSHKRLSILRHGCGVQKGSFRKEGEQRALEGVFNDSMLGLSEKRTNSAIKKLVITTIKYPRLCYNKISQPIP